jgi:hypothetical protein
VDDDDSGTEKTSGLSIRVESIEEDAVSYSMRLPRHQRCIAENQKVGNVARYSAGSDGLVEVKVLDIDFEASQSTFLVTVRRVP